VAHRDVKFGERVFGGDWSKIKQQAPQDLLEYCGKLRTLNLLLPEWKTSQYKVLIFSKSTRMLDLLGTWLDAKNYSHLRYDGSIKVGVKRQQIIDEVLMGFLHVTFTLSQFCAFLTKYQFSTNPRIFILLISTGAGSLGLNITAANIVVIFDRKGVFYLQRSPLWLTKLLLLWSASWNASIDLQAQDRAFRIGQKKDCRIFRFVSAGTVEEAQYQRQLYKQQMHNISLEGKKERRLFQGVEGVQGQEGELFGIANLLKQTSSTDHIIKRNTTLETDWKTLTQQPIEPVSTPEPEPTDQSENALVFANHCKFSRDFTLSHLV
jgi:DNA excision repair protein ERCC-6-like 2